MCSTSQITFSIRSSLQGDVRACLGWKWSHDQPLTSPWIAWVHLFKPGLLLYFFFKLKTDIEDQPVSGTLKKNVSECFDLVMVNIHRLVPSKRIDSYLLGLSIYRLFQLLIIGKIKLISLMTPLDQRLCKHDGGRWLNATKHSLYVHLPRRVNARHSDADNKDCDWSIWKRCIIQFLLLCLTTVLITEVVTCSFPIKHTGFFDSYSPSWPAGCCSAWIILLSGGVVSGHERADSSVLQQGSQWQTLSLQSCLNEAADLPASTLPICSL